MPSSSLRIVVVALVMALLATACSGGSDASPQPAPVSTGADTIEAPATTLAAPTTVPDSTTTPESTTAPVEIEAGTGNFEVGACPMEVPPGYDITCGTLFVPENRTAADAPWIELAVGIVHPETEVAGPPVIYLAGGPGGSALSDFESDPEGWEYPFLEERELVLLDQRGTGYSLPTLDCPELDFADVPGDAERDCFERLSAEGVDIGAYNTAEGAADVADLRVALGVPEWDLLGISYGTRLALEVLRLYPEGVRSAVLDSPFPPNVDTPVEEVYSFISAFNQLLDDCEADEYCRDVYPDLSDVFLETVADLNAGESSEITGDDLVLALFNAFQDAGSVPVIPWVIYEISEGNLDAFSEIAPEDGFSRSGFQTDVDVSDSEGMYYSVMCRDEYAVGDYERAEAEVVGQIPPELESALLQAPFELATTCEYWNPQTETDNSAVVSDIPTLILVGLYDTATPPAWATLAAEGLATAFLFGFPGLGHSVLTEECPIEITGAFLGDPYETPDRSCVDAMDWPYFE